MPLITLEWYLVPLGIGLAVWMQTSHLQEIRDRLQNHTLQYVSSKSYDRWNYMPEKRAGMKKWNAWVARLLTAKTDKEAA